MGERIIGSASYLPGEPIGNEAFSGEQYRIRSGQESRHHAPLDKTAVQMGVRAGRDALQDADVDPASIDLLLCFSGMPDYLYPKDGNLIREELGLSNAPAWSLDTACASFISALKCASALITAGMHERILIVQVMHWIGRGIAPETDHSSLGDGAAAVVVEKADHDSLLGCVERGDASGFDFVQLRSPFATGEEETFAFSADPRYREYFGQTVLEPIRELLEITGIPATDLSWLLPHQASLGLCDIWAKSIGMQTDQVLTTFAHTGNMSAVNIPCILAQHSHNPDATIERGDKLLLFAPGAGMHIAAMIWEF